MKSMKQDTLARRAGQLAVVVMLLTLMIGGSAVAGRGDKAGTAGAAALLIPVGARTISMSGASLATVSGLEAAFWNPPGLARAEEQSAAMFSHMNYLADIKVEYAVIGTRLGDMGSVALSVKSVGYGDIPVTTEDQPDGTGEIAHPSSMMVSAAFARAITDHIAFGLSGTYLSESMERVSVSGLAFTAGLQYSGLGGVDGLGFGVVVRNIGPGVQFGGEGLTRPGTIDGTSRPSSPVKIEAASNDLPSTIEIGLAYQVLGGEQAGLRVSSSYQNNNYSDDEYHFGAEYSVKNLVNFRAGTTATAVSEHGLGLFGPTFGIGFHTVLGGSTWSFDYGYRSAEYFSGNHIVSLAVSL